MYLAKDKELLKRFKEGDKDALDNVYRHYSPGVTGFLRKGFTFKGAKGQFYFRGIHSDDELRSTVQEVFRRAFEEKARLSYNGISSFKNWTLAIARNLVINGFRRKEVAISQYIGVSTTMNEASFLEKKVDSGYEGVLYGRASESQDSLYEKNELKGLIGDFMKDLNDLERNILIHRFAEGKGQEETAQIIGSTRMKVRTLEVKLRGRLRVFLKNSGYLSEPKKEKIAAI